MRPRKFNSSIRHSHIVRRPIARRAVRAWAGLPNAQYLQEVIKEAEAAGDSKRAKLASTLEDTLYEISNLSDQVLSDIGRVIQTYQAAIPFFSGDQGSSDVDEVQRAAKIAKNGEKFYEAYHRAMNLADILDSED